jgi:hypothetical protein
MGMDDSAQREVEQEGGVNLTSDNVGVGGDVVGRDKITTTINIFPAQTLGRQAKEFYTFQQNPWGLLASLSALFPLVNLFVQVIPLYNAADYPPALEYLSTGLITGVATLLTLFVILWTFGQRHQFRSRGAGKTLQHQAWLAFGLGLLALLGYLVVYYGKYGFLYRPLEIWGGDPRRLLGDVALLGLYSSFVSLIARAFMLLGMMSFVPQNDH